MTKATLRTPSARQGISWKWKPRPFLVSKLMVELILPFLSEGERAAEERNKQKPVRRHARMVTPMRNREQIFAEGRLAKC